MATNATAGGITPGQMRFLERLEHEALVGHVRVPRTVPEGRVEDLSSQEASRLIGVVQAARSPRPALRIKPPKPPRVVGERANKKRRNAAARR